ncbi:ABC transporter ATP-binding protein [Paraburkholderia susongensis]|uniref:Putative spermidine/putrescine transport system ATP-binding protein n=1 Tax=Paraburkholderia susongensis TaxID=1515439 RepID=A0A1X7LXC9_9BURK|nr:ABC transporter ATP-binding protein [Paraburkholderia susongensis]SMG57953.1 putative spermidine/putrescine transport system ATP-binding protein [Paraburkholderia susongensis]
MKTGSTIEFTHVVKRYGAVTALHDFSLLVEAGEFITILGSSGSGKTTALNALAGFMPITSGDIRIGGRSVAELPPERRNLGMVFQNYSLFPHMSVAENIAFPLRMRGTSRKDIGGRVKRALQAVRLEAYAGRMPRELSGGQQQRVAIARAIVFEPPVLLMDEPLGALDLKLREALQFEIKSIQHQLGCTVVYVTHDQREALAMSDRIVVLRDGRIAQVGSPLDMYDRPCSRFVAQFIGQTNLFAADLDSRGRISIPGLGVSWTDARTPASAVPHFVSVRPEHLARRACRDDDVRIDVTLDEAIFLGDVIDFSARHRSGAAVHFREPRGTSATQLQRGDTVSLAFSPGDAALVPDL